MKIKILFFLAVTLIAHNGSSQHRVTLDSVLKVIRAANPLLQSYSARARALQFYADGAHSQPAPEIGGGLWMAPYRRTEAMGDKGYVMLSVQQKITNPKKLNASEKYLRSKVDVESDGLESTFNDLRATARTAWFQWILLLRKKTVLLTSERIVLLMVNTTKARYMNGKASLNEIYRTEGKLEELRNEIASIDNEVMQKNILLNQLMNRPATHQFSIDTTLITVGDGQNSTVLRSDLKRIDHSIQSLQLSDRIQRVERKPDFNLQFSHMIPRSSQMSSQFMLLGMVSIPIAPWSTKSYKSSISGIQQEIIALKFERDALVNEISGKGEGIRKEIKTIETQLANYEQRIIPVMKKNYDVAMIAFRENNADLQSVLEAWEGWNAARLLENEIQMRYWDKTIELQKLLEY